jgi:hypothetical protein
LFSPSLFERIRRYLIPPLQPLATATVRVDMPRQQVKLRRQLSDFLLGNSIFFFPLMSADTPSSTAAKIRLQGIAPVSTHAYCTNAPCKIHQGVNLDLVANAADGLASMVPNPKGYRYL